MIEFLVATTNRADLSFLGRMFEGFDYSCFQVLVINQCFDMPCLPEIQAPHENVRVISTSQRGTSVSRNMALANARGDICTFADDDLIYTPDALTNVIRTFENYPEDIITFRTGIIGKDALMKSYRSSPFVHNRWTLLQAGDWEIFFRRQRLNRKVLFDERFGLGCEYPLCEYQIFLADAYQSGASARYLPITVPYHPDVITTGLRFERDTEFARGAGYARIMGWLGFFAAVYFAIKKYPLYGSRHSFITELSCLWAGVTRMLLR